MKRRLISIIAIACALFLIASCDNEMKTKTYTVSFNSDGGSEVDSVTVEEGKTAARPADPSKEGYIFIGWMLGEEEYDFTSSVNGDIELKALWDDGSSVARIGTALFPTLSAAFNGAEDGDTVRIMRDFDLAEQVSVEGKSIALDFDGNTITFAGIEGSGARPILIKAGAGLAVYNGDDNSIEIGGVNCTNEATWGVFDVYGNIVVNGGCYNTVGTDNGAILKGRPGCNILIENGKFYCTGTDGAFVSEGVSVINDGYFYTDSSSRGNFVYCVRSTGGDDAEITINGGTVYGIHGGIGIIAGKGTINDVSVYVRDREDLMENGVDKSFYALYVAGESGDVGVVVNGGSFNAAYRYACYIGNTNTGGDGGINAEADIEINGGVFTIGSSSSVNSAMHIDFPLGNATIKGCKSDTETINIKTEGDKKLSDNVAEGYTVTGPDENGYYSVVPATV